MLKATLFAALLCLAAGCATIDYVGDSYEPTQHVDLYFSKADVPRDYRVIGQVLASGDQYTSASRLHEKMMDRARETGADAVIILEISRKPLIDEKDYEETTTETKDDKGVTIKKSGSVSNPAALGNEIRALFIRYR